MIKFPTEGGVRVLRVNQEESRRCYATVLSGRMDRHDNLQIMFDLREEKDE